MATGLKHELYVAGAWTDVSAHVQQRMDTLIIDGQSGDGASTSEQCTFLLRDPDGRYWPANVAGPYYGTIGRNTSHRCSVDADEAFCAIAGTGTPSATTPDDASFAVTDVDVRIEADMASWRATTVLVGQWGATNASWAFHVHSTGRLRFAYSTDGSTLSYLYSTAVLPIETGRCAVRATFDSDNGGSGNTTTFYYSDAIDGSWTQLGDAVTESGTVTLYDSTRTLLIGDAYYGTRFDGRVYAMKFMDSIGGSAVADPDFTTESGGTTSFDDDAGNTWTINSPAEVIDRCYLWHGEISEWPHDSDETGTYQTVSCMSRAITARRLSSSTPISSPYYRGCTSTVAPVEDLIAYYPMEDGANATRIASGLTDGHSGSIVGDPSLASNTAFACSSALPVLSTGDAFTFSIPAHTLSTEYQMWGLWGFPSTITSSTRLLCIDMTGGSIARLTLNVTTAGYLQLTAQDDVGATIYTGGSYDFDLNGKFVRLTLSWYTSGSNTIYCISTLEPGATSGGTTGDLTITGYTHGRPLWVALSPSLALDDVTTGHHTVQTAITSVFDLDDLLAAYAGETAEDRLARLGEEEDIPMRIVGGNGSAMGPQSLSTLRDLISECETADDGILSADPDRFGLRYRTRSSMCGTDPTLTLDYDAGQLSGWQPVYDDQYTVNRLKLSRTGGGSYVAEVTTGSMSISDPPDGAGLTPDSYSVNVESDIDLPDQTHWRLSKGTCPDPRLPSLPIQLARTEISDATAETARNVGIGDRIDVTGAPVTQYPGDLQQILIGRSQTVTPFTHLIDYRCRPYDPYRAGRYADDSNPGPGIGRYSGAGTVLAEDLDTTETGVDVTAPTGVEWTHADGDYDLECGGEVMTVTGLSGSAPSYTLTVTRSVNGVVTTHSTGAAIDLAEPVHYMM